MIFLLIGTGFLVLLLILLLRTARFSRHKTQKKRRVPIDVNIDQAAQRLSEAISYQTVSTQSGENFNEDAFLNMHEFLQNAFPLIHQTLQMEIINRFSLLYTWKGSDPELEPVMLTCHLDVVPVEPGTEDDWKHPPFEGTISDGYIWGRGAMDVQGGVLAIMEAVEHLLKSGFTPKRTVMLGFGHDEEVDGDKGAYTIGKILKERGVKLAYLLDEGTPIVHNVLPELPNPVALVAVAEKGYLSLELSIVTEGGHSSVPQGLTSIAILSDAIHKLETNPIRSKVDGLVKSTMEAIGPQMPFIYRVIMANLWLFSGLVKRELARMPATKAAMKTTTATTIFESGVKENVLPTQAKAIVNFRIHPNDSVENVKKHVADTINDPRIEIKELDGSINPSYVSDVDHPAYKILKSTINEVFPEAIVAPTLMIGATDARHYSDLTDNIFRFIPLRAEEKDLDRVHGVDERISKENYREMIFFYTQLIEKTTADSEYHI